MKTVISIIISIIFCLVMAGMVSAENKQVTVAFDMVITPYNIVQPVKITLYQNNQFLCDEADVTLRVFTCPVLFTSADVNIAGDAAEKQFALTVTDNRGVESDMSESVIGGFEISNIPPLVAPVVNTVVIKGQ